MLGVRAPHSPLLVAESREAAQGPGRRQMTHPQEGHGREYREGTGHKGAGLKERARDVKHLEIKNREKLFLHLSPTQHEAQTTPWESDSCTRIWGFQ